MAIHEHWIPPVWEHNGNPLFTGNPVGKCESQQNKWLFNGNPGQVKPSCWPLDGKTGLRWTGSLHSIECTRVLCILTPLAVAVYLQCIGHFSREWLRFTGSRPRPQRELNCNDYSTHLATKGKETIVFFTYLSFNSTFRHFTPLGKLTQDLYKVINSSSDVIGWKRLTGLNMLLCVDAWIPIREPFNTKLGSELTAQGRFAFVIHIEVALLPGERKISFLY